MPAVFIRRTIRNGPLLNQLYYELEGTTLANNNYTTLDSSDTIATADPCSHVLGVNGIVNCSKGAGEDAVQAKNFIHELRPNQTAVFTTGVEAVWSAPSAGRTQITRRWPASASNPWRYVAQGTNNPGAYDFGFSFRFREKISHLQLEQAVQINSPLP